MSKKIMLSQQALFIIFFAKAVKKTANASNSGMQAWIYFYAFSLRSVKGKACGSFAASPIFYFFWLQAIGFINCRSSRKYRYTLKIVQAALACKKNHLIACKVALNFEVYARQSNNFFRHERFT